MTLYCAISKKDAHCHPVSILVLRFVYIQQNLDYSNEKKDLPVIYLAFTEHSDYKWNVVSR